MILKVIIIDKEKVNYSMPIEKKLAAIMFTDIVGYTAQMSKDESAAIQLLSKKEKISYPFPKAIVEAWEKVK